MHSKKTDSPRSVAHRLVPVVALLVVVLAACAPPQASAPASATPVVLPHQPPGTATWAPWPSALHDARHSGSSTADGPREGTVRWKRKLEGAVTPGPIVGADGTIYVTSNGGVLHALNPSDGSDRWTYDSGGASGGDLSTSPLVLPDGAVLLPSQDRLIALSSAGKPLWSTAFPGRVTSPVSADGRRVYVGDSAGTVAAVDVAAGHRVAWRANVGSTSYGSVVTDGKGRIYTTADSALVALDDQGPSARTAWRSDPHDDITEVSAGLAADGTALLGTNGAAEWAYRPDGSLAWKAPRIITYSSPAVTATGLAYVADHSGIVHVFDVRSGAQTAVYGPIGAAIWSSTVVDRAYRVYFGGQNGHVHGFDGHGTELFDVDLGGPVNSYPALTGDGALIIGSDSGFVTSIG